MNEIGSVDDTCDTPLLLKNLKQKKNYLQIPIDLLWDR